MEKAKKREIKIKWGMSPFFCHCEERSDAAISTFFYEIASFHSQRRIATLPSVLAMTYN